MSSRKLPVILVFALFLSGCSDYGPPTEILVCVDQETVLQQTFRAQARDDLPLIPTTTPVQICHRYERATYTDIGSQRYRYLISAQASEPTRTLAPSGEKSDQSQNSDVGVKN